MPKQVKVYSALSYYVTTFFQGQLVTPINTGIVIPPTEEEAKKGIDPRNALIDKFNKTTDALMDEENRPELEMENVYSRGFYFRKNEKTIRKIMDPYYELQTTIEKHTPGNAPLSKAMNKMNRVILDAVDAGENVLEIDNLGTVFSHIMNCNANTIYQKDPEMIRTQNMALQSMPVDIYQDAGAELWKAVMEYRQEKKKRPLSDAEQKEFNNRFIAHLDVLVGATDLLLGDPNNPPEGYDTIYKDLGQYQDMCSIRGFGQPNIELKFLKDKLEKGMNLEDAAFLYSLKEQMDRAKRFLPPVQEAAQAHPEQKVFQEVLDRQEKLCRMETEIFEASVFPPQEKLQELTNYYRECQKFFEDNLQNPNRRAEIFPEENNPDNKGVYTGNLKYGELDTAIKNSLMRDFGGQTKFSMKMMDYIEKELPASRNREIAAQQAHRDERTVDEVLKVLSDAKAPWYHSDNQPYLDAVESLKRYKTACKDTEAGCYGAIEQLEEVKKDCKKKLEAYLSGKEKVRTQEYGRKRFSAMMTALAMVDTKEEFEKKVSDINKVRGANEQIRVETCTQRVSTFGDQYEKEQKDLYNSKERAEKRQQSVEYIKGLKGELERRKVMAPERKKVMAMLKEIEQKAFNPEPGANLPEEEIKKGIAKNIYLGGLKEQADTFIMKGTNKEFLSAVQYPLNETSMDQNVQALMKLPAFDKIYTEQYKGKTPEQLKELIKPEAAMGALKKENARMMKKPELKKPEQTKAAEKTAGKKPVNDKKPKAMNK